MTLVTLDEARDRLPELVRLMAGGERVVFLDDGKWVAALAAAPPMPLTAEQEAARQARVRDAIKETVRMWIADGAQLPDDSPLLKILRDEA